MHSFVPYERVFGKSISYQELIDKLRLLPIEYWLRIASMGQVFLEYYQEKREYQDILFNLWFPKDLRITHKEGVLFHRVQLLVLLRLALVYCRSFPLSERTEKERKITTAECLLGINCFLYKTEDRKTANGMDFRSLVMNYVQVYYHSESNNLSNALGRMKSMLFDIPADAEFRPEGVEKDLLETTIKHSMGLSLQEYASLSFGLIAKYYQRDKIFTKEFGFPIDRKRHYEKATISEGIINRYFESVSQSQSEFIGISKVSATNLETITDFSALMLKPIVYCDGNDDYYPASLTFLQRLFSSGFLWQLDQGVYKHDTRHYWGQAFEFYCKKICERISLKAKTRTKFFSDIHYETYEGQKRSCDAIIIQDDRTVLLEFKTKFPELKKTIVEADFDSFMEDISQLLIGEHRNKAAKQIDSTIKDIRNGRLRLAGVDPKTIRAYFPVVVTPQAWPVMFPIYELIRREVSIAGLLRLECCAQLELWSCEELEYIEGILTSEKYETPNIVTLVFNKHNSDYYNLDMHTYLFNQYQQKLEISDHLKKARDEMFDIVRKTLSMSD
jgi:hypothetical protein